MRGAPVEIPHSIAREISDMLMMHARLDTISAHKMIQSILKQDSSKWELWLASAEILRTLQRYKDAESSCIKAQELAPDTGEVWFETGILLADMDMFADACDKYDKALEVCEESMYGQIAPNDDAPAEAYMDAIMELSMMQAARADARSETGRHDEALKDIDMALTDMDHPILLMTKAWITSYMDDHAETIGTIDKILGIQPNTLSMIPLLAYHLAMSGDFERATKVLEEMKDHSVDNPSWRNSMIMTLYGAGNYDEALEHVQYALDEDPTDPDTWYLKALATVATGGDAADVVDALVVAASVGPDLAGRMLKEKAFRTHVADPRLARLAATGAGRSGSGWREAVAKRRKDRWRFDRYGGFLHNQYRIGTISTRVMGYTMKAHAGHPGLSNWDRWVQDGAINMQILHDLSRISMIFSSGLADDALSEIKSFIKSSSVPAELVQCGHMLMHMGDNREAMKTFDKALKADPGNEDALQTKFDLHMRSGDLKNAEKTVQRMLKSNPDSPSTLSAHAHIMIALEMYQKSVDSLNQLRLVAPWDLDSAVLLADLWISGYELENALEVLDDVLKQDKRRDDAWVSRATGLYDMDRLEEALESANEGLALNPKNSEGWYQKARILSAMMDKGAFDALLVSIYTEPANVRRAAVDPSLAEAKRHPRFHEII